MLTVRYPTLRELECSISSADILSQSLLATFRAEYEGVPGSITANSSPPYLVIMSDDLQRFWERFLATVFRHSSPCRCPYVSL